MTYAACGAGLAAGAGVLFWCLSLLDHAGRERARRQKQRDQLDLP